MVVRKSVGTPALFASLSLLVLLMSHAGPPAPLATPVCGPINSSTTWTLPANPYVVTCDVTVNAGVTLTVEPGVVVKFQYQGCDLIVDGRLLAQGTQLSPIAFTSYKDDAHGGDTNGDSRASSPAPGDWGGVVLTASSSGSILDHTWIGYGGYGGVPYGQANLHLYTSDATVQNNTIAWSDVRGLHVGGVDPAHPLLLTNNTFLNNTQWAIYDDATGDLADITLVGNTSSGSWYNGFGLMGAVAGSVTYSSPATFPFVIWDSWTNLTVEAGSTLTLSAGTVVKFQSHRHLIVDGRLVAQGTEPEPIVFTSLRDDAHGGDTNGDGSATGPAPGDWSGIALTASSSGSVLDHTWIGYGGYGGAPYSYANLYLYSSDATVQNNTIAWSAKRGLYVGGVDPAQPLLLTNNTFLNNTEWAIVDAATGDRAITLVGNTSSGSWYNGFCTMGVIAGTVTYSSPATFPFIIWNDLTVQAGSALTFSPGMVVKFDRVYDELFVDGRMVAQGTEAEPIVFTSLNDDAHGGDTNGDGNATSAAPGDWGGIAVAGDAAFGGASLLYAGYAGGAALRVQTGGEVDFADGHVGDSKNQAVGVSGTGWLRVSGSRIEHNQGSALVVDGDSAWVHVTGSSLVENGLVGNAAGGVRNNGKATVVLGGEAGAGNTIMANAGYGAYQAGTGATMLATYNWWGDASGPYHPTLNPGGLGEEVSDRVAFAPWLSESNALPAAGLVDLLAPLSFSPGETFNLAVQFGNVLTETLEDVAVVVQLPELSEYVLGSGGGLYRPEEHDVVWRLGDVAPGQGLNAMVRIETAWGLPAHTYVGAKALVAATNLPNPAVDLDEVLSYTPVTTLTQQFLTPAEIAAELAADPELEALYRQAQDLGFTFYDTALSGTYNTGGALLTLVLIDHERMEQVVYVRRDDDRRTILHTTPAYATEYNDDGGWRYDQETGEWSFWGELAAGGAAVKEPLATCPSGKTPQRCFRNCLLRLAGIEVDWLGSGLGDAECQDCRLGGNCSACTKSIVRGDPERKAELKRCWNDCKQDANSMDCKENAGSCYWDPDFTGRWRWYAHREVCDPATCDYLLGPGLPDKKCDEGQVCVAGCCQGWEQGSRACSTCGWVGAEALSAPCTQQEEPTCTCKTGLCKSLSAEARTAQDPNAKLGPAEAAAGEWISYTVQFENLGAGTAYGVYVEDRLSPLLDDSTLQIEDGGLYFPSSRTIYWPVGELAPGAGGSLDVRVQVPTDAVSGTVIVNSATVYFPSVPETTPTGDVVTLVQDLVAHSQRVETAEGVPLAVTLTGHSPVGPLTYQVVAGPGGGTLSGTPPNVIYTPAPNFEGPDRFTFRVSDGLRQSWPAEVSIVVRTGAETIRPEVYATSPSRDETGVRVSDTPVSPGTYTPSIYVYFSEPIDAATVTAQTLFVADAQGRHLSGYTIYDASGYMARFVPQEPFQKGATYTATVTTGVHDTSGNALAASYVWSFATEAGPAGGAVYLPLVLRQH